MMTDEAWDLVRYLATILLFFGYILLFLGAFARVLQGFIVETIKELRDDADKRRQDEDESDEEGEQ